MKKANQDIRDAVNEADLKLYEVAKEYGISDSNFTKLLRYELNDELRKKIKDIIIKLNKEKEKNN